MGEFVATLENAGRRGRTLMVFTSDNGGLLQGGNPYVGNVPPTPALSSNHPLRGQKAVLRDGWKLLVFDKGPRDSDEADVVVLYHVARDPSETENLASREPARVAEMRRLLADLRQGDRDELPADRQGIE